VEKPNDVALARRRSSVVMTARSGNACRSRSALARWIASRVRTGSAGNPSSARRATGSEISSSAHVAAVEHRVVAERLHGGLYGGALVTGDGGETGSQGAVDVWQLHDQKLRVALLRGKAPDVRCQGLASKVQRLHVIEEACCHCGARSSPSPRAEAISHPTPNDGRATP